MALSFYLNGSACDPPQNWEECEIECSWENNSPSSSLKINSFDFVGYNAQIINGWIYNGLVGGLGIFEGIPFQIKACEGILIFDGILDLTHESNKFDCDRCTVFIRENVKIDWLNDVADSFTFAYLASTQVTGAGHITPSDYVRIPYVISTLPNYTQLAMLGISTFVVVRELKKIIFYELPSVFYNIGGAVAGGITWGLVATFIIQLISLIAYIIILCIMLVKLVNQLLDSVCQPDKYKYGMKVKTLFEKACAYLGLTFNSSIFNTLPFANLTIIPQKTAFAFDGAITDKELPFDYGIKSWLNMTPQSKPNAYGYYDGTFGSLIREMNDIFNAKVRISGNMLSFEVFDHVYSSPSYQLPDIVTMPNNTNASELCSNYYVEFITDSEEINTYDKADKSNAQCMFTPINVNTQKNVLLKNLDSHTFNYAMAKRKNDYTAVEQTFNSFFSEFYALVGSISNVINEIVGGIVGALNFLGMNVTYNPITIPQPTFGPRVGHMLLETDFIGVQKLLLTDSAGVLPSDNITYVNAQYLLQNFHNHSFIQDTAIDPSTGTPYNNQFWKYKDKEVPFCCSDYLSVIGNNWIRTFTGERAKALKLIWSPEKEEARVDYNVKKQYTKNIKQTYMVDGVTL